MIADVRRVLEKICNDPSIDRRPVLETREKGYNYSPRHPMNRYSDAVREKIETYLDMILRADPGASDGVNTCRVYSPEINTQEKLRRVLEKQLDDEDVADEPISSSTLQRMINSYLRERNCNISFTQSDHNTCPICKILHYALLRFNYERKMLESKKIILGSNPRPFSWFQQEEVDSVASDLEAKAYQESACLKELREHNIRDAKIRKFIKDLTDYFRPIENSYRAMGSNAPLGWRQRQHTFR